MVSNVAPSKSNIRHILIQTTLRALLCFAFPPPHYLVSYRVQSPESYIQARLLFARVPGQQDETKIQLPSPRQPLAIYVSSRQGC
jgi:hypothetical protein